MVVNKVTTRFGAIMATSMFRQTISFTQPQESFLKAEARRLGITVSDVVRRIVDQYRDVKEKNEAA